METIKTNAAPAAIGPYSQALKVAGFVYCSGQIPLDPLTMELVDGDAAVQTEQVMKNLSAVLLAAGCGLDTVVKTTIYLQDMDDFAQVNEVYSRFFAGPAPARVTVQVAALPKGAQVEIDAVAWCGD